MRNSQQNALLANILINPNTGLPYRGQRNNNLLNIRYNKGNNWQGQTGQDDSGYAQFDDRISGIRAADKVLNNYGKLHNINTIEGMVNRFAPKDDNNPVNAYIDNIYDKTGIERGSKINLQDPNVRNQLLPVMGNFETPGANITLDDLQRARGFSKAQTIPSNNQGAIANPLFNPNNQGRINVDLTNNSNEPVFSAKDMMRNDYYKGRAKYALGYKKRVQEQKQREENLAVARRENQEKDVGQNPYAIGSNRTRQNNVASNKPRQDDIIYNTENNVRDIFDAKAGIPYSGQRDYSPGLTNDVPGQDDTIYDIQNKDGTYTRYSIPGNIKQNDIPDWIESDEGKSRAGMFPKPIETTNAEVVNADSDLFKLDTAVGRRNYNLDLDPDNAEAVDKEAVDKEAVDKEAVDAEKKKSRLGNLLTPQAFGAEDSRLSKLNELIDSDYMPKGRDNKKYLMGLVGSILADRYGDPTVDTNNFGQFLENTQTQDLQDRQAFEKRRDEAIALRDSLRADKNMVAGTLGIYRKDTPEGPQNIGGYYTVDGTFVEAPEMFMGNDMGEVGITSSGGKKVKYTGADGVERDGFEVTVDGEKLIIDAAHAKEYFKDRDFNEEIQKHQAFVDKFATQDQFTKKLLSYARDGSGELLSDDEIRKNFQGIVGPVTGMAPEKLVRLINTAFGEGAKTSFILTALESFKSGDYSIAYDTLKGAGQITEFEAATVAASYNMVSRATDPVDFVQALLEHRENMTRLANNQKARLGIVGYKVDTGFAKSDWQPNKNVNYETITDIKDYES